MGRKKNFPKADLTVPTAVIRKTESGGIEISKELISQAQTVVRFPAEGNATDRRSFDFSPWYGVGVDQITYAFQNQVERFLLTGDGDLSIATIAGYCGNGAKLFLDYCVLTAGALGRDLVLPDIGRPLVDGYLFHLRQSTIKTTTQRHKYTCLKAILVGLAESKVIVILNGEEGTFPPNPFPNIGRKQQGEKPLDQRERKTFAAALKTAVMPIFHDGAEPTADLLTYAILAIALRTGRNTTPLLELPVDCLRPHPKKNMRILVCFKRRGATTHKVALRDVSDIAMSASVLPDVVRLIERAKILCEPLQKDAPAHLKGRLWLYRNAAGRVTHISDMTLMTVIQRLVKDADLVDANGDPLRVNISRLRKTFANRIFEILDGDIAATARALGNTARTTDRDYLIPSEDAKRNWSFMGQVLANELETGTLVTQKTPTSRCSDPKNGQLAPKNGTQCMNFLACLRCRNFVVTGDPDDLHRLFSFFWLVVRERDRVTKKRWKRHYAHLVRLIERDVVDRGIAERKLDPDVIRSARDRARTNPHPFWSRPDSLEYLQ